MPEIFIYVLGFIIVSIGFVIFFGAPYVPTLKKQVENIFVLYPVTKQDVFVDVGSGDGVVLRAAARRGAKAIGYELNPWLYVISNVLNRHSSRTSTILGNFWQLPLPEDTTVVYTFLRDRYMKKLEKKLEDHINTTGKPLVLISYSFKIPKRKITRTNGPMFLYEFKA